jgi:2-polyprenyl-6-methoxyphenol hydroxylase-like FAD-dependent oxidoreductase
MSTNVVASPRVGAHAIVFGGSMAGLVTAGVLSRHFERVTIVERDVIEPGAQPRKGVPQALHVHGLLERGMDILCEIFPGFREELRAAGSHFMDMTGEHAWYMSGLWRPRMQSGIVFYAQSRPLLESVVRKCVVALPNVRVLDGREVAGYQTSPDKARVTGVRLRVPGGEQEEVLEGQLVVDASGRGSRTPQWLEALGYPRVEETRIQVDVVYTSRMFRKPPGFVADWKMLSVSPELPRERRVATIQTIEEDRWLVCIGGWLGMQPPLDDAGYVEFTKGLAQPHIYEALKNAEPIGPINVFRFSHNQRRHYERMTRFPVGLALVGDAFCSFNPIYGQGMTTGALQARTLGECLAEGGLDGVSRHYRQRVGELLQIPWTMSTSADLRFPEVGGKRSPLARVMDWYGDRVQRVASHDAEALRTMMRVMHMLETPTALFSPKMALKVLSARPTAEDLRREPAPFFATQSSSARSSSQVV